MKDKALKLIPILSGVTTAVLWGFSFLFTKDALSYTFPNQLLGMRFASAALTLTMLSLLGVIRINLKGKKWFPLVILSLFQPGLYFIGETWGVKWTNASEAGMIIALAPVVTALMAAVFLKERMNFLQGLAIMSSVLGVFVIIAAQGSIEFGHHLWGILALFVAVLAAGGYSILSKKSSTHFSPLEITFVMMWSGAILFNVLGVGESAIQGNLAIYLLPLKQMSVVIAVLYLGVLSSVVGFFMFNFALSRLTVSQTAPILNLITVVSVFGGVVFQGDPFGWMQVVGVVLIILGVWGTNVFAGTHRKQKPSDEEIPAVRSSL